MLENIQSTKRVAFLDVMKGIGILLVCLGHSVSTMAHPLNMFVLSFHMPLFFFVSGVVFVSDAQRSFKEFVIRKMRAILLPYVILVVLSCGGDFIIEVVIKKLIMHQEASFELGSAMQQWFLIALFLGNLALWCVNRLMKTKTKLAILIPVCAVVFYCINYTGLYLQQTLVALLFMLLGYVFRDFVMNYETKSKMHGCSVLLFPVVVALSSLNKPIGMFINQYGNKILFLVTALIGVVASLDFSVLLQNADRIAWLGKNSIYVYIIHFTVQRLLRAVFKFVGLSVRADNIASVMLLFIATILIVIPLVQFANRYLYFLFGRKKERPSGGKL